MVWVSHSWTQNSLTYDAQKIGICDFGPFLETYYAEILGTEKRILMTHSRHPPFRWHRFGLYLMKTVGVTRTN